MASADTALAAPRPLTEVANSQDSQGHSACQASDNSQTASEFIDSQLRLEADAREALPYSFDTCTQPLGPLRQALYSCLTCNPPPAEPSAPYTPAGVCYSCSIACHGKHTLVELFENRNFTCDCGSSRLPVTSPCTLRINQETGTKGGVHSEKPPSGNEYNQNFRNRFCGCSEVYDVNKEKGTMYQCLGLGSVEDGGCGEDWWHPECIVGLWRTWYEDLRVIEREVQKPTLDANGNVVGETNPEHKEHPQPPGFPNEDDFETFICYKCVDANPWIKRYAGTDGFLLPVYHWKREAGLENLDKGLANDPSIPTAGDLCIKKRKLDSESDESSHSSVIKRQKNDATGLHEALPASLKCRYESLPQPSTGLISLFAKENFREHFCRCRNCFPSLGKHQQLLEEEDVYEQPLSESGDTEAGGGSVGTGSLLDLGEAALSNVDRVRAIEGVMVYNHLKDKVKTFLQPFAESGQAVGAEDIKAYFEKLRGDAEAIKAAGGAAVGNAEEKDGDGKGDSRREQSGY